MAERCPFEVGDMRWALGDGANRIAEMCLERCINNDAAVPKTSVAVDHFEPSDCGSSHSGDIEYDDTSLQRASDGAERQMAILSTYEDGCEAFAEEYIFTCPNT